MRFKPGHVLYGSRRTYLRKVAVADFEGVTANTTFVVESKDPQVLLPELLPFIMQTESFHEHSIKQSKGSVNPYVNFSDLTRYEFALPPLEEQRRIANAMRTAQAARECVLRLANEHSRVLESLYQHEFGSRREHIEAPGGTPLGGLSTIRRGASPRPISDPRWFSASGPGWVRIRDLANNSRYLRITEQKLSALGAERSVPVYPGEVILSIAATIGRPAIADAHLCIHDGFVVFKDLSPDLDRDYLFHFLRWMEPVLEAKGLIGTQKNINTTIVGALQLDLPSVPNQREVAAVMNAVCDASECYVQREREIAKIGMQLIQEQATAQ